MMAARTSGALPWCATRMTATISPSRDPENAAIIGGRAASSSPKKRASTSLSAVQPAECKRPV